MKISRKLYDLKTFLCLLRGGKACKGSSQSYLITIHFPLKIPQKNACFFRNNVICYSKFYRNGDKKHVFYKYAVYSSYYFSMADFSYYGHRLILTDCRMRMAVGRKVLFGYAGIGIIREPHGIYTLVYVAGRFFFYIQVP